MGWNTIGNDCSGANKVAKTATPSPTPPVEERKLQEIVVSPEVDEPYNASERRTHNLKHTKLDVRFDWEKRHLIGKAVLDLEPYFYPSSKLVLDAKGFDINDVLLVSNGKRIGLKHAYDGLELTIELDRMYSRGQEYSVEIDYVAKPDELEVTGSAAITDAKGLYFINPDGSDPNKPKQIWTQGETEGSSCWFPTIDAPNENTTQEIYMTVQDKYVTLSNGKKMSSTKNSDGTRTDYWKQDVPHAPYLFMMAVGEFDVVQGKPWRGKVVDYYMESDHSGNAGDIFGNTTEMMEFYSKKLKYDYPWDKYSQIVVRDFVSGAMENSSAVIFFDAMHLDERELLDETHEDIVAHELFHHWFGDIVTCESWANLPLNESFATYGEYLWIEHKYGREEGDEHLRADLNAYLGEVSRGKKVAMIRYNYEDKEDMFDAHSYQKGGRILHMLRKYVGDDAFWTGLNKYLVDNAHQPVEIHQLRIAFEEVVGEDLNWFFNQWFLSPGGHPILNIDYRYDEGMDKTFVKIKQEQDEDVFDLPMAIDVYRDGKMTRDKVVISDREFEWSTNGNPDWINVDGEKMLLCEKFDNKTSDQYVKQYREGKLYLDRLEAIEALATDFENEDAMAVMQEAMNDPFWAIREQAVASLDVTAMPDKDKTIEGLKTIALKDEKSAVRGAAMEQLSGLGDDSMSDVFVSGLKDQSYGVWSTALAGLSGVNPDRALKEARGMKSAKQGAVVEGVSSVLGSLGDETDLNYFEDGFGQHGINTDIGMYLSYADLLPKVGSKSKLESGINTLGGFAADDSKIKWLRFFAMRALNNVSNGLAEKQGGESDQAMKDQIGSSIDLVKDVMSSAKKKESDQEILGLCQRFGY